MMLEVSPKIEKQEVSYLTSDSIWYMKYHIYVHICRTYLQSIPLCGMDVAKFIFMCWISRNYIVQVT